MTQVMFSKTIAQMSAIVLISGMFVGCAEKDLYDPDWNKNNLPPEESYFGYEMRGEVKLNVNYNAPGFQAIVEVYDQNPVVDGVKKADLEPIYSAYINDGKLERTMYVSTAIKEVYLYTDNWSLPQCVKMELTKENGAVYDATKNTSVNSRAVSTRAANISGNKVPYEITNRTYDALLYSLSKWDVNGVPNDKEYLTQTNTVEKESVSSISERVLKAFDSMPNKLEFLRDANVTNINVAEEETTLDVVILAERGQYHNTFGYYYYKTEKEKVLAEGAFDKSVNKYIIFPDASLESYILKCGNTAHLQFFGEDGKATPTDKFPKGYTVGWFFISNGYNDSYGASTIRNNKKSFYSNNTGGNQRFVSLNDPKTGIVILGFEDQETLDASNMGKEDFSDVLFFVKSNKNITKEERPEIPEEKPKPQLGTASISGTLAFEDIWPTGGDYDMNDVVIEYNRSVEYNEENKVTKITDYFKPVNDGAKYNNFFAYQMKNLTTMTPAEGVAYESGTNSAVITSSMKEAQEKEYTVVRTFGSAIDKDVALKDFNPFIIVNETGTKFDANDQKRTEVHLPKQLATDYANKSLNYTKNDAYYIQKDGKYPFAIDIPVTGFKVATEQIRIDADAEYPKFRNWADSKGADAKDWYKK